MGAPSRSEFGDGVHLELSIVAVVAEALELVVALGAEAALAVCGARLQIGELRQEVLRIVSLVELWLIRRGHRLVANLGPVNLLEPWVLLDLLSVSRSAAQALVRVLVQKLHAKVARIIREEGVVEARLRVLNILVELLAVFRVEGRQAHEHLVDNCAKRPPIRGLAMALSLQHLRRQVLSGAAEGLGLAVPLDTHLGQAEVGEFDVALSVDKHVLRFQTIGNKTTS